MSNIRKFVTPSLVALLCLPLASCGDGPATGPKDETKTNETPLETSTPKKTKEYIAKCEDAENDTLFRSIFTSDRYPFTEQQIQRKITLTEGEVERDKINKIDNNYSSSQLSALKNDLKQLQTRKKELENFVKAKGRDINARDPKSCKTILFTAVERGEIEMVQKALELSANPNLGDRYHNTPLNVAIAKGDSELVSILLDSKELDVEDQSAGFTTLMWIASLHQYGSNNEANYSIGNYSSKIMNAIHDYYNTPNQTIRSYIESRNYCHTSDLIRKSYTDKWEQRMPTECAELVKKLIDRGARFDTTDDEGRNVFMISLNPFFLDGVLKMSLPASAGENVVELIKSKQSIYGHTLAMFGVLAHSDKLTELLASHDWIDFGIRSKSGQTVLELSHDELDSALKQKAFNYLPQTKATHSILTGVVPESREKCSQPAITDAAFKAADARKSGYNSLADTLEADLYLKGCGHLLNKDAS